MIKGYRKANPKYTTVHKNLVKDNGPANIHDCIMCGETAKHWACINWTDTEVVNGYECRYSKDINDYRPMCVSCHIAHDKKEPKEFCIRGHNDWYVYKDKNKRYCRQCAREQRKDAK